MADQHDDAPAVAVAPSPASTAAFSSSAPLLPPSPRRGLLRRINLVRLALIVLSALSASRALDGAAASIGGGFGGVGGVFGAAVIAKKNVGGRYHDPYSSLSTSSLFGETVAAALEAASASPGGVRVFNMIQSDPWDLQVISYWGENRICKILRNESVFPPPPSPTSSADGDTNADGGGDRSSGPLPPRVLLNVTFGCANLFRDHRLGTGNHISSMLGMRLATSVRGADLMWRCHDAEDEKSSLVMPWLMGYWPAATSTDYGRPPGKEAFADNVTLDQACGGYDGCPISVSMPFLMYALRRMAVALVGVPSPDHPAWEWSDRYLWGPRRVERGRRKGGGRGGRGGGGRDVFQLSAPCKGAPPLFPSVELDDAVVHFRCGDLAASNHPSFGFMRFSEFRRRISPSVRSIGIVTQPFHAGGQLRPNDKGGGLRDKCKMITMAMVRYLSDAFPAARVTVRNDSNETIALTYARMVMANQTFSPISSFSVFPAAAAFGTGYVRSPDFKKAPNKWMVNPKFPSLADMYPGQGGVELMEKTDLLYARHFRLLDGKTRSRRDGINYQVEWFVNDKCCP